MTPSLSDAWPSTQMLAWPMPWLIVSQKQHKYTAMQPSQHTEKDMFTNSLMFDAYINTVNKCSLPLPLPTRLLSPRKTPTNTCP